GGETNLERAAPAGGGVARHIGQEPGPGIDRAAVVAVAGQAGRPVGEPGRVDEPVALAHLAPGHGEALARADRAGVGGGVLADDVDRMAEGEGEAAALPDGEAVLAPVLPHCFAGLVEDAAARRERGVAPL